MLLNALSAAPSTRYVADLSRAIELAIGPVFLLSGVYSLLGVLTNRLGRIIDRLRVLEGPDAAAVTGLSTEDIVAEISTLDRRATTANWAIGLSTSGALFIAAVVIELFFGQYVRRNIGLLITGSFVCGVVLMTAGLSAFLHEVHLGLRSMQAEVQRRLARHQADAAFPRSCPGRPTA